MFIAKNLKMTIEKVKRIMTRKKDENDNDKDHKSGFLLEAGSQVPAPVYFEQSTRLLIVRN